jgi:thiamine biosynthesis lipoprotein
MGMACVFAASCVAPARHLDRFEYSRISMGVQARIALYAPGEAVAIAAARAAFERIDELDRELSDYDPESELSQLGARSGGAPVAVSSDLLRVLQRAVEISRASGGAFDVTAGPLVKVWREARQSGALPSPAWIEEARAHVGWEAIEIDARLGTVRLAKAGMCLDLGGIGKGFACDEALEVLRAQGVTRCLVSLAGDIRLGAPPPGRAGWDIAATSDAPAATVDRLVLSDCAVSTSGDAEQALEIDGVRYSHVIDPRSGRALTSRTRATVIARDGATADALATAADVLGPEAGIELIGRIPGAEGTIETTTGSASVRRRSAGYPAS